MASGSRAEIALSNVTLRFEFTEPAAMGAWTLEDVQLALGLAHRLVKAAYDVVAQTPNRPDADYPIVASLAKSLTIRRLHAGSLELAVLLPAALATVKYLGPFMDVVKRALSLDVEIRARREELKAEIVGHREKQATSYAQLIAIKSAGVEAAAQRAPRPQVVAASVDDNEAEEPDAAPA
jgi:hypothetical protein